MQRPPPYELTEPVHTKGVMPPHLNSVNSGAIDHYRFNGTFGTPRNPARYQPIMQTFIIPQEREFQNKAAQIHQVIEVELAATRLEESTHPLPPAAAITRELGVRNKLIQRKSAALQHQTQLSLGFYGSDPTNKTADQFLSRASALDKRLMPDGPAMSLWKQSYRAALEARLLTQTLAVLHQQQVNVHNWLAAVQANDHAQAQAAETARQLAEQARIAAEQQRQRDLAEAARRQQEQLDIQAREQARLAALAQAQRLAAEQARIAAEAAARQVAAEQARLEVLAEQQREAEAERNAQEQQKKQSGNIHNIYPASGTTASSGPVFSLASSTIRLSPATSAAILTGLRSAVLGVTALGTSLLAPVLVGFAALLMPSRLGNGDRFTVSVALSELSAATPQTLREIADRQGTLEMPVGLGTRRMGAGAEVFVVTADDFHVRSNVPVLHAMYDSLKEVYSTVLPDSPSDSLTWTPAITPASSTTELPITDTTDPAYTGAPIMPIEGRLDLHPRLEEEWSRFIIVFPEDSGIAPLYVVFSSPYEGAYVKGKYSGRIYNPEQSGGPILNLDWRGAVVTQSGINDVKLHVSRLNQSDANDVMTGRLEKILRGDLNFTDTDLRYYTHEIRELERYRAFGYSDSMSPTDESPIWNNAHTATLEDYKLGSELTLLYIEEAISAMNAQDQREYENDMRNFGQ